MHPGWRPTLEVIGVIGDCGGVWWRGQWDLLPAGAKPVGRWHFQQLQLLPGWPLRDRLSTLPFRARFEQGTSLGHVRGTKSAFSSILIYIPVPSHRC